LHDLSLAESQNIDVHNILPRHESGGFAIDTFYIPRAALIVTRDHFPSEQVLVNVLISPNDLGDFITKTFPSITNVILEERKS
jgi:hypothetical protein